MHAKPGSNLSVEMNAKQDYFDLEYKTASTDTLDRVHSQKMKP